MRDLWPIFAVGGVFVLCVSVVLTKTVDHETSIAFVALCTLAGLVVGFIDRNLKQYKAERNLEDTRIKTEQTAKEIGRKIDHNCEVAVEAVHQAKKAVRHAEDSVVLAASQVETTAIVAETAAKVAVEKLESVDKKADEIRQAVNGNLDAAKKLAYDAGYAKAMADLKEGRDRRKEDRP